MASGRFVRKASVGVNEKNHFKTGSEMFAFTAGQKKTSRWDSSICFLVTMHVCAARMLKSELAAAFQLCQ